MSHRPNPERARMLAMRGYNAPEVTAHMLDEGRDVDIREVTAWIGFAVPPKLYEFEGARCTVSEIAELAKVDRDLLADRLKRGMSVADAITRRKLTPAESARFANSPWRTHASCGGGSR